MKFKTFTKYTLKINKAENNATFCSSLVKGTQQKSDKDLAFVDEYSNYQVFGDIEYDELNDSYIMYEKENTNKLDIMQMMLSYSGIISYNIQEFVGNTIIINDLSI